MAAVWIGHDGARWLHQQCCTPPNCTNTWHILCLHTLHTRVPSTQYASRSWTGTLFELHATPLCSSHAPALPHARVFGKGAWCILLQSAGGTGAAVAGSTAGGAALASAAAVAPAADNAAAGATDTVALGCAS